MQLLINRFITPRVQPNQNRKTIHKTVHQRAEHLSGKTLALISSNTCKWAKLCRNVLCLAALCIGICFAYLLYAPREQATLWNSSAIYFMFFFSSFCLINIQLIVVFLSLTPGARSRDSRMKSWRSLQEPPHAARRYFQVLCLCCRVQTFQNNGSTAGLIRRVIPSTWAW